MLLFIHLVQMTELVARFGFSLVWLVFFIVNKQSKVCVRGLIVSVSCPVLFAQYISFSIPLLAEVVQLKLAAHNYGRVVIVHCFEVLSPNISMCNAAMKCLSRFWVVKVEMVCV